MVSTANGTIETYTSIENLTVEVDFKHLSMITRLPKINAQGNSFFKIFYAFGELTRKLRPLGQNLTINGEIGFLTDFGDSFTVTSSFNWQGSFTRSTPFLLWDEGEDLITLFLGIVLVSILFLAYNFRKSRRIHRPS